jgi:hypothetical protein
MTRKVGRATRLSPYFSKKNRLSIDLLTTDWMPFAPFGGRGARALIIEGGCAPELEQRTLKLLLDTSNSECQTSYRHKNGRRSR